AFGGSTDYLGGTSRSLVAVPDPQLPSPACVDRTAAMVPFRMRHSLRDFPLFKTPARCKSCLTTKPKCGKRPTERGKDMHPSRSLLAGVGIAVTGILCATSGPGGVVRPQAPAAGSVQPWGLPPLPAGVGPVEKFADVSDTPQGKFLEGGSFDTQGNLWFVAIGSGWISYLTPDGKLVPVFNCNPPAEIGQTSPPPVTH